MNYNGYGYAMSNNDDDEEDDKKSSRQKKDEADAPEYNFEGYDVEINTKVVLMPKSDKKASS